MNYERGPVNGKCVEDVVRRGVRKQTMQVSWGEGEFYSSCSTQPLEIFAVGSDFTFKEIIVVAV